LLSKQGVPGAAVTTGFGVGFGVGFSVTTGRFVVGLGVATSPGLVTGLVTGPAVTGPEVMPLPPSQVPQLLRQLTFIHVGLFSHSPA